MGELAHRWAICEICGPMVVCGECGNNCCNGGHGEIDGLECGACASAYEMQANDKAGYQEIVATLGNQDRKENMWYAHGKFGQVIEDTEAENRNLCISKFMETKIGQGYQRMQDAKQDGYTFEQCRIMRHPYDPPAQPAEQGKR